jgi:hypothetical protein
LSAWRGKLPGFTEKRVAPITSDSDAGRRRAGIPPPESAEGSRTPSPLAAGAASPRLCSSSTARGADMTKKEVFQIIPAELDDEHAADTIKVCNGEMTEKEYLAKWKPLSLDRYTSEDMRGGA